MNSINGYKVVLKKQLKKQIKRALPPNLLNTFERKLKYLANNPFHPGLNTKQIRVSEKKCKDLGVDEVWEFYINMRLRCIIYVVHSEESLIIAYVGDHADIVRRFGK